VLSSQGEFKPARKRLEHAIAVLDRVEGAYSLAAADAREPLMELVFGADGPNATLPIVERRLATYSKVVGDGDPRTGLAYSDLGAVYTEMERSEEAEAAFRKAVKILETVLPGDDPRVAYAHNNLGNMLLFSGRPQQAEPEVRRAIAIRSKALGPDHPDTLVARATLTQVLIKLERLDEADRNAREVLAASKGRDRFATSQMKAVLAQVLLLQKRHAEALRLLDEVLAERREFLAPDHILNSSARFNRAQALFGLGRVAETRAELRALRAGLEAKKGDEGKGLLSRLASFEKKVG
jgi:tetratricopeptide (TPR) repeat protein